MPGSLLHGSWEISAVPDRAKSGGTEKVNDRHSVINGAEKSDVPVVPKKLLNEAGAEEAMEERGATEGNAGEAPAGRTQSRETALMGLESIRDAARRNPGLKFTSLLHHITPSLLVESFYELKRNAAAGVDGVTWGEYENILYGRVSQLHKELHTGAYRAQASRRVHIPKADGKLRPLGIAAVEDKIVQQAVVKVLNMIYEEDFLGFSYGFRRGRGQHDALDAVSIGIESQKIGWILDADIQAFFDTIDHKWMMRFLEHRIMDQRLLRLIHKWLKAGVIEDGRRTAAEKGTPQGSVISPLLANIYLHYVYDLWAHQWRGRHATGRVMHVRYADDSVSGFERQADGRAFLAALRERLAEFELALHPEKTRLIEFGRYAARNRRRRGERKPETFDFLGFTHCCGTTRQGGFKILRLTIKKRMRATLKAIREQLRKRMHQSVPMVGKWLRSVVQGYFNYFAVPGNAHRLTGFRNEVCRAWRRMLLRRSQRHGLSWKRFNRLVDRHIPPYRNTHPYPDVRFRVKYPR
jgi:RNA-directed DNA polymerase